ncbi:MAG: hypothetical protein AAGA68_13795 [Pseudomonadota bacterium]
MTDALDPRIMRWMAIANHNHQHIRFDSEETPQANDTAEGLELRALIYNTAETDRELGNMLARIKGKATVTRIGR